MNAQIAFFSRRDHGPEGADEGYFQRVIGEVAGSNPARLLACQGSVAQLAERYSSLIARFSGPSFLPEVP